MFDSSKQFKLSTIDGKACVVRFPADKEWCERTRKNKTVRTEIGRGLGKFDPGSAKRIDAELFGKIRADEGEQFDESEAAYIIGRLDRDTVLDVSREGNRYRITLKVPGPAKTVHSLKRPSLKQAEEYSEGSRSALFGDKTTQYRVFLEPAGVLYDSIAAEPEGYVGAVPIIHKQSALNAMLKDIAERLEEDDDPEA